VDEWRLLYLWREFVRWTGNWRGDGKLTALADYLLAPKKVVTSTSGTAVVDWVFNDKMTTLQQFRKDAFHHNHCLLLAGNQPPEQ
jgi:hypothetical protein